MKTFNFYKMSGAGNDFIIVDNREKIIDENDLTLLIKQICRRKLSVGSDGFILIEKDNEVDFKWHFFNSDGSRADMCGNGARCAARFAYINQIADKDMAFRTDAGIVYAHVENEQVKIKMPDPKDLRIDFNIKVKSDYLTVSSINTGVPHVVLEVLDIENTDVFNLGKEIRYHDDFKPAGTNVNFICLKNDNTVAIRTYERGVEDETLACGTGSIAAALVIVNKKNMKSPIKLLTRSGSWLNIYFKEKEKKFFDIYLEGDARIIYKGKLWEDAWK